MSFSAALVPHTIFGKPLGVSLKTASVQISTANADGELYIWGYIPVVVAKWYVSIFRCLSVSVRLIILWLAVFI